MKRVATLLLFSFTFFSFENFAKEDINPVLPAPVTELGISAVVGNVNVITGDYVDHAMDLVLQGPEQLTFERSYASSSTHKSGLYYGWRHNHNSWVDVKHQKARLPGEKHRESCLLAKYMEKSGRGSFFLGSREHKNSSIMDFSREWSGRGHTNCGEGVISARTNLKHTKIKYSNHEGDRRLLMQTEDGCHYIFNHDNNLKDDIVFGLAEERKPNGHHIFYKRDDEGRIKRVEVTNANRNRIYSSLTLTHDTVKELEDKDKESECIVTGSDDRTITYKLKKIFLKKGEKFYCISEIIRPNAPPEKLKWICFGHPLLKLKEYPEGRHICIGYYAGSGDYQTGGKTVHVDIDDSYFYDKVHRIFAPHGKDGSVIPVYSFEYKPKFKDTKSENLNAEHISEGYTNVFDALNHRTKYEYDVELRLNKIKKYTGSYDGSYKEHSIEKIEWGITGTPEDGYLLGRYLLDGSRGFHHGHGYEYDEFGNIKSDTFYGNISGKSPSFVYDRAILDGCERYSKSYKYSTADIKHLIIEEKEDNGKKTKYTYYPGTDLLASKFICENDRVCIRHFFEYDEDAVLIKTIIDDGFADDVKNVSGVTERRITYIEPTKIENNEPYGLPKVIKEKYCEKIGSGISQNEILLSKVENFYTREGYLYRKDVYDSNEHLAYSQHWEHDSRGRVKKEINAIGDVLERSFDGNDNIIEEKYPNQRLEVIHTYNLFNKRTSTTEKGDGISLTTTYTFDELGNCTSKVDPFDQVTYYQYDEFSRLKHVLNPSTSDPQGVLYSTQILKKYDIAGNVIEEENQYAKTVKTYNAYGKPLFIQHPDGTQETYEYALDGTLKKSRAANGLITIYENDCFGRTIRKTIKDKEDLIETSIYDAFHLRSTTDPIGLTTYYEYDGAGRLISIRKEDHLTQYEYDPLGRRYKTIDWYGAEENAYRVKTEIFDNLNRLIEEKIEDGKSSTASVHCIYRYDPAGNIFQVTRDTPEGLSTTEKKYNAFKQVTKITDPLGYETVFTYDYSGKFLKVTQTDHLGLRTITTMNAMSKPWIIEKIDLNGKTLSRKEMFYNGIGDCCYIREMVTSPNASERYVNTCLEYDEMHRLRNLYEAHKDPKQKHTEFVYNSFGQKEKVIKPDGTQLLHTYDALGRLKTFRASDGSFSYEYTYDKKGNPISVVDKVNNMENLRTYDDLGHVKQEVLGNGLELNYRYDRMDRPIHVTLPDKSVIGYGYDALHLSTVQRMAPDNSVRYTHEYTAYDSFGNPAILHLSGNAGSVNSKYDLLGRVKQSQAPGWSEALSYDAVGNLFSADTLSGGTLIPSQYKYDDTYQLKSETGMATHTYECDSLYNCLNKDGKTRTLNALNQLLTHGDAVYTYDTNGNLIESNTLGKITTYTWDAQDRLLSVDEGNSKYCYIYDAFNRRLKKQAYEKVENDWRPTISTNYIYQGQNEIGSVGQTMELRILGVGKGAEIGAAVAIEIDGQAAVPIHDHNGNVVMLLDMDTGSVIESYRYSAFGEEKIIDQNGNDLLNSVFKNPWRFSSKRIDDETGFVYFGRRYYDPGTCRWVSPDPLSFEGGPNLYAYVMNSPLTHIDLYGLRGIMSRPSGDPWRWSDGLGAHPVIKGVSKLLSSVPLMKTLGSIVYQVGSHFLPLPVMETALKSMVGFASGESLSWKPERSHIEIVGDKDLPPGYSMGITPGMNNDSASARQLGEQMSKASGGYKTHVGANGGHGTIGDLLEGFVQYWGIFTNSVQKTMESLSSRANEAMKYAGRCLHEAHSQGGLILYRALHGLTEQQRRMFDVVTYGSAKIINPNEFGLASAMNYVSWMDIIPFIGDPIGIIKGIMADKPYVTFLTGGIPFYEHCMSQPAYRNVQRDTVRDFVKHL